MVADYLRDEFLARQSPDEMTFLIATSVLDRMTGPLCDAVLGCEGSAQTLRRLSRSNLLVVPLDRKDEQYRYHALMREMLASELHRLGEHREAELHARASQWYAGEGDLDRAIPHAISAGNVEEAARLIWANTADYESHGREATMRRWLDRFTEDEIAASPYLSLAKATNHTSRGEGAQCDRWTATAKSALANVPEAERGPLEAAAALMRAGAVARDGIAKVGEDAARTYPLFPDESPFRSMCRLLEGAAHHLAGDRDRARPALEEAAHRGAAAAPTVHTIALAQLALLELEAGDGGAAAALTLRATSQASRFGLDDYPILALVYAVSALMRAKRGGVEEATRQARRSAALLEQLTDFSPWYEAEARIVLARALLLLDDVSAARGHLGAAERLLRKTSDAVVLQVWLEEASQEVESVAGLDGRWPLTTAELRLLHFLPSHLSFREIGEQLFVSTNTVKTQAQAIYRKLGVSSRAEAVACAEAAGLVRKGHVVPSVEQGEASTRKGL
jgi:LuxR family maltose regulon positive regulatory protein